MSTETNLPTILFYPLFLQEKSCILLLSCKLVKFWTSNKHGTCLPSFRNWPVQETMSTTSLQYQKIFRCIGDGQYMPICNWTPTKRNISILMSIVHYKHVVKMAINYSCGRQKSSLDADIELMLGVHSFRGNPCTLKLMLGLLMMKFLLNRLSLIKRVLAVQ